MARQSVTTQRITRAGTNVALSAPNADGDIVDTGQVALVVTNGGGSPITVTVITPGDVVGLAVADLEVTVPASGTRHIGPLPTSVFAQAADAVTGAGRALVDYSSITSVTRAVISF